MTPVQPTLPDVIDRLDALARYMAYLDKRFDDVNGRLAATKRRAVVAVDGGAFHLDATVARATRHCVTALVCAQLGQLAAVTILLLALRA